jgi:LytS/YehU family sensor histidine kinase
LILKDEKEKSAGMVARLSQFLRYSLYESNSEQVPVEKEIQLLKDYVALESVRLNLTKVQFAPTSDGSVKHMPPLLFMPLVENSFKYAADQADAHITIELRILDKKIYFSAANTVDQQRLASEDGGIGLNNFKKRLELYYAGHYRYAVNNDAHTYSVSINIDSHE